MIITVGVSLVLSTTADCRTADHRTSTDNPLFLDCDVEEPNAALFLKPVIKERREVGQLILEVDFEKCTYCGRCAEVCQYHAIAGGGERVPLVEALPEYTAVFRELGSKTGRISGQTGLGVRSIPSD